MIAGTAGAVDALEEAAPDCDEKIVDAGCDENVVGGTGEGRADELADEATLVRPPPTEPAVPAPAP